MRNGRTALTAETSKRSGLAFDLASAAMAPPAKPAIASIANAAKPRWQITRIIGVAPLARMPRQQVNRIPLVRNTRCGRLSLPRWSRRLKAADRSQGNRERVHALL